VTITSGRVGTGGGAGGAILTQPGLALLPSDIAICFFYQMALLLQKTLRY